MLQDLSRYWFFLSFFGLQEAINALAVHKSSIPSCEIVESAYEKKNRALTSLTMPQIFGGRESKKNVCEQAKNVPIQAVNT